MWTIKQGKKKKSLSGKFPAPNPVRTGTNGAGTGAHARVGAVAGGAGLGRLSGHRSHAYLGSSTRDPASPAVPTVLSCPEAKPPGYCGANLVTQSPVVHALD